MKRAIFVALLLWAGCGSSSQSSSMDLGPSGTLRLTLTTAAQISGINFYTLKLVVAGQTTSLQIDAPSPTLPPSQTLDVDLHSAQGAISVTIEADDSGSKALGSGTGTVQAEQGKTTDLTISLQPV